MTYKPIDDKVLMRVQKVLDKACSGIILPDSSEGSFRWIGEVIAVGGKVPNTINQGDKVYYNIHGAQLADKTQQLVVIPYSDIYCVLEDK